MGGEYQRWGMGWVAGYRTSGESQRPGFAWFFGMRCVLVHARAKQRGDFETARTALAFVAQFQRGTEKFRMRLRRARVFVNWFKDIRMDSRRRMRRRFLLLRWAIT